MNTTTKLYKAKICLFGEPAVGKTSLIKRYVYNMFDDRYLVTIGTKVSKKTISLEKGGEEISVELLIWDIIGHKSFRNLLLEAYFYGAQGLIGVCDISRKITLESLSEWIEGIRSVADVSKLPTVLVINKIDLDTKEITEEDVKNFAEKYGIEKYVFTSAKDGTNVNEAFTYLAEKIVQKSTETQQT